MYSLPTISTPPQESYISVQGSIAPGWTDVGKVFLRFDDQDLELELIPPMDALTLLSSESSIQSSNRWFLIFLFAASWVLPSCLCPSSISKKSSSDSQINVIPCRLGRFPLPPTDHRNAGSALQPVHIPKHSQGD